MFDTHNRAEMEEPKIPVFRICLSIFEGVSGIVYIEPRLNENNDRLFRVLVNTAKKIAQDYGLVWDIAQDVELTISIGSLPDGSKVLRSGKLLGSSPEVFQKVTTILGPIQQP